MGSNGLSLHLQLPTGLINFWAALLIGKVKETYERPHQSLFRFVKVKCFTIKFKNKNKNKNKNKKEKKSTNGLEKPWISKKINPLEFEPTTTCNWNLAIESHTS
jgi:hypothetical protein